MCWFPLSRESRRPGPDPGRLGALIVVAVAVLAAGCESNPPRGSTPEAAPVRARPAVVDPQRAALAEAQRAYDAGQDARALELYLPLARAGDITAQSRLARIYTRNRGVPVNETESCDWWQAAAERGDATAQVNVGLCFETGKGRAQEHRVAAEWYRRSAEQGNAVAMYNLGLAHEYGRGVAQSFEQALDWFQRALDSGRLSTGNANDARRHLARAERNVRAARGDPAAALELALFLRSGDGGESRNERRGLELLRRAAEMPNALPEAWFHYGLMVFHGQYADVSDLRPGRPLTQAQTQRMEAQQREGARWVKRAVDAGVGEAIVQYATWTACGAGVRKDAAAAEQLLASAAERGHRQAAEDLAEFLTAGRCGMRRDPAAAAQWRAKASAGGK